MDVSNSFLVVLATSVNQKESVKAVQEYGLHATLQCTFNSYKSDLNTTVNGLL